MKRTDQWHTREELNALMEPTPSENVDAMSALFLGIFIGATIISSLWMFCVLFLR